MKKGFKIIPIVLTLLIILGSVSACKQKNKNAETGYSGVWHYDSEYHWRDPDENGDDWKARHNFVDDVCHLCGYSRKTGTIDSSLTKPSDGSDFSSGEGEPDVDDTKPSRDEFGIGKTVVGEDGYSYTEIYGDDSEITYSIGAGDNKGKVTALEIPEDYNGVPVTAVDDYGFKNEKSLQTVNIPKTINAIGYEAFAHCTALQKIEIPDSVTFMDHRAFLECSSLKSVILSKNLKNLYARAFYMCTALTEIRLPEGIEYVAKSCFSRCTNLKTLYVSSTIKALDGEAFFLCPITKVVAHSLEDWMEINFSGSPIAAGGNLYFDKNGKEELLTEVEIPEGTTKIKPFIFTNCSSLKTVKIPESVKEIGLRAFDGCSQLSEIEANGITTVISQTFQNMKGLTKITLKNAVKVEAEAFYGSSKLKEAHFGNKLNYLGQRAFVNTGLTDLYLDGGTSEQWDNVVKFGIGFNSIPKGDCWDFGLGDYIVHFEGGSVKLHGTQYN